MTRPTQVFFRFQAVSAGRKATLRFLFAFDPNPLKPTTSSEKLIQPGAMGRSATWTLEICKRPPGLILAGLTTTQCPLLGVKRT